ncbi:hypothetical protein NEUTE1DRAFT_99376 [Neurospora tetrasperma FGSC 2508]|uniref:F-box domain-containing protein n=1 Tax=Neurospora tetrasperma (strain FGSC 2508 / ATCC MYA-4615 / P0657) TaxID=510951 RepID=F8MFD6_NEUT8|nr:uncharacterized protein NEUTE1DRAFT_99376 [Neurospora tetrasperma FGSC 2508]EGO59195.1 hypothetical protein NEUTE1DRAFT_99376 [Neurospora tetrasperma FGSC 2508]EGZ73306.1 hypothetical protein NEUTE2DRAFT_137661 [Neurospora tetrasperma FGSC 2509]
MSLTTLPPELRHKILASVIWTPTATLYNHLDLFYQDPPRVRLRDDWDIWIPATSPQPPALPLLLTCRILRDDVQYLLHSPTAAQKSRPYEIDIVFIPKCGIFPTWVCCPLPSQFNLDTLQASFRIMDVEDIDDEVETVGRQGEFLRRFHGISSNFNANDKYYPNPPPGSWNFYRLLVSFLALGPRGLCSPAYQRKNRGSLFSSRSRSPPRYSLRHLIISVTSKEETETDEERWERADRGAQRFLIAHNEDLPYGAEGEEDIFPGPPPNDDDDDFAQYTWTGPTDLRTVRGMHIHAGRRDTLGHADRYGLYLANTLWALLDFGGWLSRGFGLMLYESILDDITFYVDGEPRPRFGMDDLLLSFLERPKPTKPSRTLTPEVAAALKVWKEWVMKWRTWRTLREGCSGSGVLDDTCMEPEPRPSFDAFVRYLPASTWDYDPNEPEYSDSDADSVSEDDANESIVNK